MRNLVFFAAIAAPIILAGAAANAADAGHGDRKSVV